MKRCCVIGGGGFIGINLANHLARSGWDVTSFGRAPPPDTHLPEVRHLAGEFDDIAAVEAATRGMDVIFHLVGSTPARAEVDRVADLRASVENSLRLLQLGASGGFGKIVFLSSGGTVYGVPAQLPISETAPQWPISAYGVSKVAVERYVNAFHWLHGLNYGIARVSNPFGPHQRTGKGQGVVATLVHAALRGQPFTMLGDGSTVRDYLYVDDLVGALAALATHDGAERIFNIGSGVGTELRSLIAMVEKAAGAAIDCRHGTMRTIDVPANVLDVGRAAADLQWWATTSLPDGLARTVAWMESTLA